MKKSRHTEGNVLTMPSANASAERELRQSPTSQMA